MLAGGQSLVPILALRLARFATLVDLNAVRDLDYVRHDADQLVIGAMTRQADIEKDELVARYAPLLARATPHIGHFQIRNRGTLGGSVVHADPAAEYPAVAVALGATMNLIGPAGPRAVPAGEFFVGPLMSAIEDDEILESISYPIWSGRCGFAVQEIARREGDFAMAGAAVGIGVEAGTVRRASGALFGVGSTPVPLVLDHLVGESAASLDTRAIAADATAELTPPDDVHASGRYRRHLAAVLVARVLDEAVLEATA